MFRNVSKCFEMFQNVSKCFKMLTVSRSFEMFKNASILFCILHFLTEEIEFAAETHREGWGYPVSHRRHRRGQPHTLGRGCERRSGRGRGRQGVGAQGRAVEDARGRAAKAGGGIPQVQGRKRRRARHARLNGHGAREAADQTDNDMHKYRILADTCIAAAARSNRTDGRCPGAPPKE